MQWAYEIGAKRALSGGVSDALLRAARDQILLDAASGGALPVSMLHSVALRLLGVAYARRQVRNRHMQAEAGTGEPPFGSPDDVERALGGARAALSDAVVRGSVDRAGERAPKPDGVLVAHALSKKSAGPTIEVRPHVEAGQHLAALAAAAGKVPTMPGLGDQGESAGGAVQSTSPREAARAREYAISASSAEARRGAARGFGVAPAPRASVAAAGNGGRDGELVPDAPADTPTFAPRPAADNFEPSPGAGGPTASALLNRAAVAPRGDRELAGASAGIENSRDTIAANNPARIFASPTGDEAATGFGQQDAGDGQARAGSDAMQGDVFLDGASVGRWISRLLTRDAERASVGRTGFDIRRGRLLPGPTVGGP